MRLGLFLSLALGSQILCGLHIACAQEPSAAADQNATIASQSRTVDWPTFIPNVLNDQKHVFVKFPNDLIHGKHWVPVLAVAGITSGLVIADQYDAGYFRRTTS